MNQSDQPANFEYSELDPSFQAAVERLHKLTVWARWLVAGGLWVTIGLLSLWDLRSTFTLLRQYFTWAALRHGLAYHFLAAIGLGLCIGVTVATLVWQSRNILFGLPLPERNQLAQQVLKVHQQGKSHPLWRWIYP
ncbi:MAG: hypothetical protein HC780_24850 [Leptolyngbyaceae cyanobacterium CSU_1_3]|nr:hypothetical protein [Leptolyngbyaceae cyanobacterium CSU_1_3]